MSIRDTEMSYRKAAVGGATVVGLTVALYDTLAGDLRRAADAQRSGNMEKRCRELDHALIVLAHLQSWIDPANGVALAKSLTALYSHLRVQMIEAQLKRSPEILEEQMRLVLEVRGSWHQIDQTASQSSATPLEGKAEMGATLPSQEPGGEKAVTRWSA